MTATVDEPGQSSRQLNISCPQSDFSVVPTASNDDPDITIRPTDLHSLSHGDVPRVHVSPPASPLSPTNVTAPPSPNPDGAVGSNDRATRRRSLIDPRNNRFSGFLSHLIRRDRDREQEHQSRADRPSSPTPTAPPQDTLLKNIPPARPITPPPSLPSPTLHDLGLSLSVLTASLSPSHYSMPPTSGTFLSPHYLLLCHPQGLDVLSIIRPPAPEPYAIIRRVPFKSVLVMEERGIMVAIAGRRDGVRFYSLEEIRKAIAWRMEEEIRRELDRQRKEDAKHGPSGAVDNIFGHVSSISYVKSKDRPSLPGGNHKVTLPISGPPLLNVTPLLPRPQSPPPEYEVTASSRPRPRSNVSAISTTQNPILRRASVSTTVDMPGVSRRRNSNAPESVEASVGKSIEKCERLEDPWAGSSDDEAISLVAAGPSGSAALDERTSAIPPVLHPEAEVTSLPTAAPNSADAAASFSGISRPRRPSNLDLSTSMIHPTSDTNPSPVATLTAIRRSLAQVPGPTLSARGPTIMDSEPSDAEGDDDRGHEATTPTGERISFAQALMESRLPELPPPGTRQPQNPFIIGSSYATFGDNDDRGSLDDRRPSSSTGSSHHRESMLPRTSTSRSDSSRRRRWTVLDGIFNTGSTIPNPSSNSPPTRPNRSSRHISRTPSQTSITRSQNLRRSQPQSVRTPPLPHRPSRESPVDPLEQERMPTSRPGSSSSRFFPRFFSNALHPRRSEESGFSGGSDTIEITRRQGGGLHGTHTAPPKFNYMKLPGIKNALMIKGVETAKKSFVAILCGDAGEKVELYAGTYRTNLTLSRTFILPDSPRNLELQLQGDDLIEVFLVFSHNVFGLEPATVRVREIRVGRAERAAARRRARERRQGMTVQEDEAIPDEDSNVTVTVGVIEGETADTPPLEQTDSNRQVDDPTWTPVEPQPTISEVNPEELLALTASQIGPYTTFQQLSFAPSFPLSTIANDWIIPPTYPCVIKHYPDSLSGDTSERDSEIFTTRVSAPPGLPLPRSQPPSMWYYKDPNGVVRGPWKESTMQTWYKAGYLPLDLPVRRENEADYVILQQLRLQSVDPNRPFRSTRIPPPEGFPAEESSVTDGANSDQILLHPISLLVQPKHFGPPALFFSSRGGHSTTIVDNKGKSVLKGRFFWTLDDEDPGCPNGKLGDIKRIEAFNVQDRAVIVALRQGGFEAVDIGDALMSPADESRILLPDFRVPDGAVSRRGTYVWRIGTPVALPPVSSPREVQTALTMVRKKHSSNLPGRSPARPDYSTSFDDADPHPQEEVLYLGRNEENVYFCERHAMTFRILRLSPIS